MEEGEGGTLSAAVVTGGIAFGGDGSGRGGYGGYRKRPQKAFPEARAWSRLSFSD